MLLSPNVAYCPGQTGMRALSAAETSIAADVLAIRDLALSVGVIRTPPMPMIAARPDIYPHPRSPYARDRAAYAIQGARNFLAAARRERTEAAAATHPVLRRLHRRAAAWNMNEAAAATRIAATELRAAKREDAETARRIARMCVRGAA